MFIPGVMLCASILKVFLEHRDKGSEMTGHENYDLGTHLHNTDHFSTNLIHPGFLWGTSVTVETTVYLPTVSTICFD